MGIRFQPKSRVLTFRTWIISTQCLAFEVVKFCTLHSHFRLFAQALWNIRQKWKSCFATYCHHLCMTCMCWYLWVRNLQHWSWWGILFRFRVRLSWQAHFSSCWGFEQRFMSREECKQTAVAWLQTSDTCCLTFWKPSRLFCGSLLHLSQVYQIHQHCVSLICNMQWPYPSYVDLGLQHG